MEIYILMIKIEDTLQPIKSVHGGYVAFDSYKNAREQVREWKRLGAARFYGYDTFLMEDVRVKKII